MQIAAAEDRPPYVQFEEEEVEDRDASLKAGHYVAKPMDVAYITPQGSKERIPREVKSWLDYLTQQVREKRFPQQWLTAYTQMYQAWKSGQEIPVMGTAIRTWPVLSKGQVKQITDANVRTVEDLAASNEETLARIGMGARSYKDRAITWLSSANNVGKASESLNDALQKMEVLMTQNMELQASNRSMQLQLQAFAAVGSAGADVPRGSGGEKIAVGDLLDDSGNQE